jgi:hypothetical protein
MLAMRSDQIKDHMADTHDWSCTRHILVAGSIPAFRLYSKSIR